MADSEDATQVTHLGQGLRAAGEAELSQCKCS